MGKMATVPLAGDDQGLTRAAAMTMRGPAGGAGEGGDPTLPLPAGDRPAAPPERGVAGRSSAGRGTAGTVTSRRGYAPSAYRPAGPYLRRRRVLRLTGRLAVVIVALILMGAVAFGGLLIVTPSVGNARQLAAAQDRAHHVAYPGPAVPPRFAESLVATEDKRFYSEPGIDLFAVGRVGFEYVTGHGVQGGATLYQQLAKLLYTHGRSTTSDEAEQVALAVKLYLTYTRQQILQMYAEVVYFGNGYYGLAAASCGYFGVRPAGLSWPQAAMLAGLVQGPSMDDPLTHPANARAREVHVVGRLVATGKLSPAQGRAVLAIPLRSMVAGRGDRNCSQAA
jgi:membrane peptidoglycan carboxypeptidase